jgi:hypothetical protein
MPAWRPLGLIWICCVIRLSFWAAALPLWEGYDEWSHFAVIRATAFEGRLVASRDAPVQRDVAASLELAPVPWELRYFTKPSITQDDFWLLSAAERTAREQAFDSMPVLWSHEASAGSLTQYEAQQPPLYYWLLAPVMLAAQNWSLSGQVMLLRFISLLIASLAIPLTFQIALEVLKDERAALGCAALLAAMPEFILDVARVGNECVAVALFSALILLGLRQRTIAMGILLGLGLLAKAYFLTAALAVLLFFRKRALLPLAVAAVIGGWWYGRNLLSGNLGGLNDSIRSSAANTTLIQKIVATPWLRAIDTFLFSHLYYGGWSSLSVRSWIYHVFYVIAAVGAVGFLLLLRRRDIAWLALIYGSFVLGLLYFALTTVAGNHGALPPSWYLFAVAGAEMPLYAAGLMRILPDRCRAWIMPSVIALFSLFDLYTTNAIAIPYYTGMIRHRANGTLAALHFADFEAIGWHEAFSRLTVFKPVSADLLMVLWCGSLLSSAALVAIAARRSR